MRHSTLAKASILCTLLSIPVIWMLVTVFVLPPIGFVLGVRSYRKYKRELTNPQDRNLLVAAFPMGLAAVVFALEYWFLGATYRA